nr:hypothetical protein [Prolixibacteraceae bacterium]
MKQLTSFLALFLLITQSFGNLAEPLGNQQDQQESLKSYSKYDFVSGDKVIYYDDFSQDAVGDFPPNWFTDASGEVMTTNLFPGKWFMLANEGLFFPEKGVALPQNYTIEFDLLPIQEDEEAEIGIFQLAIY